MADKRDKTIATMIVNGHSQVEIAKALGISQPSISKRLSKQSTRDLVEAAAHRLTVEALPSIVSNHIRATNLASRVLAEAEASTSNEEIRKSLDGLKPLLDLSDKKEERIGASLGIFPSRSTSLFFQQITNQQVAILSPEACKLLGNVMDEITSEDASDVVDVDFREVE